MDVFDPHTDAHLNPVAPAGLLPPYDRLMQRAEMAGRMCRLAAADPTLSRSALCRDAQLATGLKRFGEAETLYDDLAAPGRRALGAEFRYDAAAKADATPSPRSPRSLRSPHLAVKRAASKAGGPAGLSAHAQLAHPGLVAAAAGAAQQAKRAKNVRRAGSPRGTPRSVAAR
jgi:hypothetical protein